jgi:hypothetical protein
MFKRIILNFILPKLLKKKSPKVIPRSGDEAKKMDCYSVFLFKKNGNAKYCIVGYDNKNETLKVLGLDEAKRFSKEHNLSLKDALKYRFRITHYYKHYNLQYDNFNKATFYYVSMFDKFIVNCKIFLEYIFQSHYNHKPFVTIKRMELLRFFIRKHLNQTYDYSSSMHSTGTGLHFFNTMTELYSIRWASHPDNENEKQKLRLYLHSLVDSGDLKFENSQYSITNKAIGTLEKHEEEEKRHNSSWWLQFWVAILTFITVIPILIKLID